MKKMVASVVAVMVVAASVASAADLSAGVDLASAYVFRGVTYNDGVVLQPGMEAALPHGFTVGVWGNLDIDDYDGVLADNQISEIDIYASYAIPVDLLDLSIGYTEYTYPTAGAEADREVNVAAGYDLGVAEVGLGVYYGIDGGIEKTLYLEATAGKSFELAEGASLDLGAAVGYADPDGGESGFSSYSLSAGVSYGMVGLSVTYYGQIDDDVLTDTVMPTEDMEFSVGYDVEVVGMLSVAADF